MRKGNGFLVPDGNKIRDVRKEKGWNQEKLASKAGVNLRTLQRAESGNRVRPQYLGYIAEALGLKIPDILPPCEKPFSQESTNQNGRLTNRSFISNAPASLKIFLGRNQIIKDIKGILLCPNTTEGTYAHPRLIVHGWPGVGKSSLTIMLANDSDLIKAYPDGIVWVSLGQNPDVLSELCALGRLLGITNILTARTIKNASELVSHELSNKKMLLILDDVWDIESGKAMSVGGNQCGLLITTRLPEIAQGLSMLPQEIINLPVLSEDISIQLLHMIAPTTKQYSKESVELVRTIEFLPLAIHVAGHLIQTEAKMGWGISELLKELKNENIIMQSSAPADCLDMLTQAIPTVSMLFKKSTDMLDDNTRKCFMQLGVFAPRPAIFNFDALKYVWEVSNPKPIIRKLVSRGLMQSIQRGLFQIHSLLAAHAKSLF
jgi:transcriptional regulator with XRE-family HTH domain